MSLACVSPEFDLQHQKKKGIIILLDGTIE
jgi:hypothetical protein